MSLIDNLVREGARRMLAQALEAEVDAYLAAHADQVDERGRRLVVRNGKFTESWLMSDDQYAADEFFSQHF